MGGENAGVPARGSADVQVELNFVLQPEASPTLASSKDGLLVVLLILTEVSMVENVRRRDYSTKLKVQNIASFFKRC